MIIHSDPPQWNRFVRFTDDDGEQTYYATYTAYDGVDVAPQLLQTNDFRTFAQQGAAGIDDVGHVAVAFVGGGQQQRVGQGRQDPFGVVEVRTRW